MYQKIMVPLDGSELAETVLPRVESLSTSCHPGGIILVRVVEPIRLPATPGVGIGPESMQQIQNNQEMEARQYLAGIQERLGKSNIPAQAQVLFGSAAEALAVYAAENHVNLIVMATHGRSGVSRWVWGSVADRLLRSACAPVMVVRAVGCAPADVAPQKPSAQ